MVQMALSHVNGEETMEMQQLFKCKYYIIFALLCLCTVKNHASVKYSINEAWTFSLEDGGDKNQSVISFPHTWNAADAIDEVPGFFRGVGWYTKAILIPTSFEDKIIYMYFEGANQLVDLYINDQHVGQHKGGYTRFCFDISKYLKYGVENLFSVKVDNSHNPLIPPLSADFTFFGGIYRDVYFEIKDSVHISPMDMASSGVYVSTPMVSEAKATIEISTLINNKTARNENIILEHKVCTSNGILVKEIAKNYNVKAETENVPLATSIDILDPVLWSPDSPNLYTLQTIVRDKKTSTILDEVTTSFGLRWFNFDADKGFTLNGIPLKLIGTNRHQCFLGKGNALEDEIHVRDIKLLKDMGGNFLRVSHYPQDPLILEMCDKLGIIASVEIPIVNAVTEDQEFLDNSLLMAQEMVKQNFNHPSLVMWSYMNEVMLRPPYKKNDEKYKSYCKEVNRQAQAIDNAIRELDPSRYTMVAFHGSVSSYEDAGMFDIPMIIGWNLYQGWYGGTFDGFDEFLLDYKKKYPTKPTLITEYGADVDTRIHSFSPERFDFSVEYGDAYHEHYLKSIQKYDFISGATIWNLNDFHSEVRADAVPHVNSKGITGLDRTPKNTYYLYKAHLTAEPFVKIASADWVLRSGSETGANRCDQSLKIYSNQPEVTVFHDGQELGIVKIKDGVGEIMIPYHQGVNHIEARLMDANISDLYTPHFDLIAEKLDEDFKELNINMGTNSYFEDKAGGIIWMPEQAYSVGSWGYLGGEVYRPKTSFGSLPSAAIDILGTKNDPLFQTQRVGLEAFKADVPNGKYAIYLYWADLNKKSQDEVLAYNLGNDAIHSKIEDRVFDVYINAEKVLDQFDIPNSVGTERAIVKKILIDVNDNQGLNIRFVPIEGKTILNAIRIFKTN